MSKGIIKIQFLHLEVKEYSWLFISPSQFPQDQRDQEEDRENG